MNVDETPDSIRKTIHQPEQSESIRSEEQKNPNLMRPRLLTA